MRRSVILRNSNGNGSGRVGGGGRYRLCGSGCVRSGCFIRSRLSCRNRVIRRRSRLGLCLRIGISSRLHGVST